MNEGESASASEAQALTDGYAIATKGDKELGDTGNPGLEGFTPNQPFFLPALNEGESASASEAQSRKMIMR